MNLPLPFRARRPCRASRERTARPQAGVTLIELLIVTAIIGLVVGLAFPSAAAGVESLRLRSSAESIVSFLNTAIDRAERRQQVIEVWISPQENVLVARSPDLGFSRRLELPDNFHIASIRPAPPGANLQVNAQVNPPRRFLMYPGGTVPRIGIEIATSAGRRRFVSVNAFTGQPYVVPAGAVLGAGEGLQ